jgi:hypothetical protein
MVVFWKFLGLGADRRGILCLIGRQHRDLAVPAMPSAGVLPLPSEIDTLSRPQAAAIERGNMETETAVARGLVGGIMPAVTAPMHNRGTGQSHR